MEDGARKNEFDQPIGPEIHPWTGAVSPPGDALVGRYVELEPMRVEHAGLLYKSFVAAPDSLWTYMATGPYATVDDFTESIETMLATDGWLAYSVKAGGSYSGYACYLRIDERAGSIEIGSIAFAPQLQRTRAATEAIYLLIDHAFQLGFRRCEWKCDALNEPSRRAAGRFGFTYEGTFANATHYKGRSRDTAWYAIIDDDWPLIARAFESWLQPSNFDGHGLQRLPLTAGQAAAQHRDQRRRESG